LASDPKHINPERGEIWLVDLEPTRGSELQKNRPMVVLSSNTIRSLPVRVAVPLTGWQEQFQSSPWKVHIDPDADNKLTKSSAADALQLRCLSLDRFSKRLGVLPKSTIEEIIFAINYCLEE
jgi:mRNA interferase MazF